MTASLYVRAAGRLLRSGVSLGPLDGRLVFVFGCPRSGTTFLAGAIGDVQGFVDLGEVQPLKAAVPALARLGPEEGAERVRRILDRVRRLGLVGSRRGVEQTPETAFVLPAVVRAFPEAVLVHIVRDGRDVACSLLERGWLSRGRGGRDDAGAAYGPQARFWVESGREAEFEAASDARRVAWAWRRYVSAVRDSGIERVEVRYEALADAVEPLAAALGCRPDELAAGLARAHDSSVGRHRRDLSAEELAEVEAEAGELLAAYGY
ncbi:MAG: sulfotransferase [Thermoleophilia bacterium]|nr:sulfotransferase [Thermoleophilia bacterium]